MSRWIRNIFIAMATAVPVYAVIYEIFTGHGVPDEAIDAIVLLMCILFFGGVLVVIIWALGFTRLNTARIRQRSTIILAYLEQSIRLNLPLPQLLGAAALSEPRWISHRISKLRDQIGKGSGLADALRKSVPGISRRDLALISAAERVGRVGPQLTHMVRHQQTIQSQNIAERSFLRAYPVAMTAVIVCVISMVMIFVIPKFEQIFRDFKCPMPPLTVAVVNFCNQPFDWNWLEVSLVIVILSAIAQQIYQRVNWPATVLWFTTNRDLGDICHVIAESLEAGLPLPGAIRCATDLSISSSTKNKLNVWADGLERGMPSTEAATIAGLPKLIAGLTVTQEGFAFLSRYYAGKFSRLMTLLRAASIPGMVIFFGILVAIVALSLFLPLIALIDSVSPAARSTWGIL